MPKDLSRRRVGIAGTGAVASGYAAFLASNGHDVALWSPRGGPALGGKTDGTLIAVGMLEAECRPELAASAAELCEFSDVLIIALPAFGHKMVMDALAPYVRTGQPVIISSQSAFGALYLGDLLTARGIEAPVIAWSTTALTAKAAGPGKVNIGSVRARVDICTLPEAASEEGLGICRKLFGDRFLVCDGLLAVALSNVNAQNHLGIALCNLTRMEKGETWNQVDNMTPMIARLLEALDRERLAIAHSLGLKVRSVHEHFHLSYHVPESPDLSEMFAGMQRRGLGGNGPVTPDSRYVTEDVPYGIVPIVALGDLAGCPAALHGSGLDIFCALYGRDFRRECDLLEALDFSRFTLTELAAAGRRGTTRAPQPGRA
ncbi:MAG: NAD/NADP octopine/nopaline dehydrogenase family protein [Salinarimonas sp.]|nr:NAD/NADP octopine/nopaline dehydrogenase family protein [Salinarimonas sp.]